MRAIRYVYREYSAVDDNTCALCGLRTVVLNSQDGLAIFRLSVGTLAVHSPLSVLNREVVLCDQCIEVIKTGKATTQEFA